VASNLANAESVTAADGKPYRAKQVVFEAMSPDGQGAQGVLLGRPAQLAGLVPLAGEFLIGSADWMDRNLSRRVEAVTPVTSRALRERLWEVLQVQLEDRRNAWEMQPDGIEKATVRGWTRRDWGEEGTTMAWCCTEEPEAYTGGEAVVDSLAAELAAIAGPEVFVRLRSRLSDC